MTTILEQIAYWLAVVLVAVVVVASIIEYL